MKTLLLYGTSIFLVGLTELLRAMPSIRLETCLKLSDLGDLVAFDAVIVDLNDPQTSDVLNLLRAHPALTVIGVNTASGTVTVLSGRIYMAQSLKEVIQFLDRPSIKDTPVDPDRVEVI